MLTKKVTVDKVATLTGHRDSIYTVEGAGEPDVLFSAGSDGMVVRWDTRQPDAGRLLAQIPASVYALRWQATTNHLWVGQNFEGIHVIDLANQREIASIRITTAAIFDIQFFGQYALVGTGDGTLLVVDIPHMAVKKFLKASDKPVRSIAVNAPAGEVAVGYSDHFIRVFALETLALKYTLAGHTNSVFTLTYSPDYQYLLSGSRDAHLRIWRTEDAYALDQSIVAHMYAINHVAFSTDGRYFATRSMDKSIKVWEAATFRLLKVIDRARHAGHGTSINKLLWLGEPYHLISASDDRTLSVWKMSIEPEL
jgi:WD40 repeat protein